MTDGPQKSLPMNLRWRQAASAIANQNSSRSEIMDALGRALRTPTNERAIARVRNLMQPDGQGILFALNETSIQSAIDGLGPEATGSSFCQSLIDACQALALSDHGWSTIVGEAVKIAVGVELANHMHGMTEHWFRQAKPQEAMRFRERCVELRRTADLSALAERPAAPSGHTAGASSRRSSGLDEGVSL
jgi:hypothetical protein